MTFIHINGFLFNLFERLCVIMSFRFVVLFTGLKIFREEVLIDVSEFSRL